MKSPPVIVSGPFDEIRFGDLRFLEEASRFGDVHVLLWPDAAIEASRGRAPRFPLEERLYFLQAVRFVSRVTLLTELENQNELPRDAIQGARLWVDVESASTAARRECGRKLGLEYRVVAADSLSGLTASGSSASGVIESQDPRHRSSAATPGAEGIQKGRGCGSQRKKKVVVTGCYDWLHSGHVRFFEEVSAYGDLYVIVGHDANIRLLKGEGHPLLSQEERRYLVGAIRFVKQGLISSGNGWLDADPEIRRLRPDIYAVNEDGDRGGKREYCNQLGLEYLVLKRAPAPGLPRRTSTELRGY